ncbi:MAG: hypothetical protein HKN07_01450 [Acidimicrobiia bacterium]|nr:hypothetical protein [Acidimicrobiia bacterium]
MTDRLRELVEGSDLDGLIRHVDGLASSRDWNGMLELRRWCYEAAERGKQLFGPAQYAEYRLALEAPAAIAADMAQNGVSRFTLGPLWEVAASTHTWDDISAHLAEPVRTLIAHERSIRGDDMDGVEVDEDVLGPTVELAPWEPTYAPAVYRSDKADFPEPNFSPLASLALPNKTEAKPDDRVEEALRALVTPWVDNSNGRAEAVSVNGDALQAIRTLGAPSAYGARVEPEEALAYMAWTAASGGAHGRRRGLAVGRSLAWWVVAAMADMMDVDLLDPDDVGDAAAKITWYRWQPETETSGWSAHLAAQLDDRAWALSALDAQ